MDIKGGCLCGTVRYSADVAPVMTAVCHCAHCQKQSGTAFSIMVAVPRASLKVEGDSLAVYEDTGASGLPVHRRFCGACGSPILTDAEALPDLLFIKAGTLDDPSSLKPEAHIWCDHAQHWVPRDDKLPQAPGNPDLG